MGDFVTTKNNPNTWMEVAKTETEPLTKGFLWIFLRTDGGKIVRCTASDIGEIAEER